ncbi:30S ribosomal protein S20 [Oceanobacillus oncorhynchi subsp. incaldanensis]|uniref:Small ribosomal subunit protein bS20 n=2 Tax=Oceanobacillus TaxID=182709 RepID=A0A0A1MXC4_9BACI|nr:30S ribosomal protein S20 [Oceanobacillus oncorhynchi]MDM8099356.1 30S ribosomal protein S20 [Oceanobacillus oncorhynchi]UUI38515.1 30S ribosomal protein S20 [Oceanobacillus oncorhynchi]GIO19742.1 30S ribosomal protein S20 [Oceanobacillus oncorhynchi subsp. incaldanensis]CEI84204.1 30S ribosomal protein S20 [Oceanobacillus oncorhynchi]
MANIKSAIKRVEVNQKKRANNVSQLSAMRTEIKRVEKFVEANDVENAKAAFQSANKQIDKAAQKGIIHKNAASRQKSRLAKKVNAS